MSAKWLNGLAPAPSVVSEWTTVRLGADATNSTTTAIDVTGLGVQLTPGQWEVEGRILVQTITATTGAQVGLAWPTGATGAFKAEVPSSATASVIVHGKASGERAAGTGLAVVSTSYLTLLHGLFTVTSTLASPGLRVQLTSEVAASQVSIMAGSFIRYRQVDAPTGQANRILQVTQAQYTALAPPDPATLYVVVG